MMVGSEITLRMGLCSTFPTGSSPPFDCRGSRRVCRRAPSFYTPPAALSVAASVPLHVWTFVCGGRLGSSVSHSEHSGCGKFSQSGLLISADRPHDQTIVCLVYFVGFDSPPPQLI